MDNKKKLFVKKNYHGDFGGSTKFEGRIEVLKTAVYNCIGLRQSELYVWTRREIADNVGKTLKYYDCDTKPSIEHLELQVIPKPGPKPGPKPMLGVDDA